MAATEDRSAETRLAINFGAMAKPIRKQLLQQKCAFDNERVHSLQNCADAVVMLSIHGFLSDAERQKIYKRLLKEISGAIG